MGNRPTLMSGRKAGYSMPSCEGVREGSKCMCRLQENKVWRPQRESMCPIAGFRILMIAPTARKVAGAGQSKAQKSEIQSASCSL
jgi:hypothetical protein